MQYWIVAVSYIIGLSGWLFKKETPLRVKIFFSILLSLLLVLQVTNQLGNEKKEWAKRPTGHLTSKRINLLPYTLNTIKLELGWGKHGPGAFFIYSGGPLSNMLRSPGFKVFDDLEFKIDEIQGQIKVSMIIRDKNGKYIAKLVDNEWQVAPSPITWDKNYTKDTLEIINERGEVVLQLRKLPDRIQLNGVFYDKEGNGVSIAPPLPNGQWVSMKILGKDTPPDIIEPIFEYPSEKYFGKLKRI